MTRAVAILTGVVVLLAFGFVFSSAADETDDSVVTVYLTPTCGCCGLWADYLEEEGFEVETQELPNLAPIRTEHGVPPFLASCHTAVVGGYVVEGHVPAEDVRRLLEEKPAGVGLAVPGMPIGSPGMEIPGRPAESYEVFLFDERGNTEVFARH